MSIKVLSNSQTGSTIRDRMRQLVEKPYNVIRGHRLGEFGFVTISMMILLAIFAPYLAPYRPYQEIINPDGTLAALQGPSVAHPLGTTRYGYDVLSQLIVGARAALLVGFLTAIIVLVTGTTIGIVAGYYGGYVDEFLMRFTDIIYGIPILPFAIVVLSVLQKSIYWIIFMLGFIYWRNCARVIRSQVLTLREEEFIQSAETTGASTFRIMYKQILPNVLPVSFLYFTFAVGWSIVTAANIAFLGFGDPNQVSWGRMMFAAFNTNSILQQPVWALAPGVMIVLTVASVYFIGRTYEEVADPRLGSE